MQITICAPMPASQNTGFGFQWVVRLDELPIVKLTCDTSERKRKRLRLVTCRCWLGLQAQASLVGIRQCNCYSKQPWIGFWTLKVLEIATLALTKLTIQWIDIEPEHWHKL